MPPSASVGKHVKHTHHKHISAKELKNKRCGVKDISNDEFAAREARTEHISTQLKSTHHRRNSEKGDADSPALSAKGGRILTHIHVIYDPETKDGLITETQMDDQLAALNEAFKHGDWDFRIKEISYIANASWVGQTLGSAEEIDMYSTLRKGKSHTLNVFFVPYFEYLGVSSFPDEYKELAYIDGVTVESATVPGGDYAPYNLGMTLIHEVGHWMGLYHTFRGGCGGYGDGVHDTADEAEPNFDCVEVDSCPTYPGVDPIENYMDYTDDLCMNHFTQGQFKRMQRQWDIYRSSSPFAPHHTLNSLNDIGGIISSSLRGHHGKNDH